MQVGNNLTLEEICTCTQTYIRYAQQIDPYPRNSETVTALIALAQNILDPIIGCFGRERFQMTYVLLNRLEAVPSPERPRDRD